MEWNISTIERKCSTCYHFSILDNHPELRTIGACGECKRNAPTPVGLYSHFRAPSDLRLAVWPIVREEDSCSKWECSDEIWDKFEKEYYSIPLLKRIWYIFTLRFRKDI